MGEEEGIGGGEGAKVDYLTNKISSVESFQYFHYH